MLLLFVNCEMLAISLHGVEISLVPEVAPRKSVYCKHTYSIVPHGMLLALRCDTATQATFYECFFCASTHHVVDVVGYNANTAVNMLDSSLPPMLG